MQIIYVFNLEIKISAFQIQVSAFASGKHAYIILTHLNPTFYNNNNNKIKLKSALKHYMTF